jgi:hypothetical protein
VREATSTAEGSIGITTTTRYTLDEDGNAVLAISERRYADESIPVAIDTVRSTFNKRGDIVSSITEHDDGDGIVDGTTIVSYSYDPHRNLIRIVREFDNENDGVIDYIQTFTRTYERARTN